MEIGISTATFFSKAVTEDSFSVIKNCGGECAEVFLTTFYEFKSEFADIINQKKGDLKVYSIHSLNTTYEPQLFVNAPRTRMDAEKILRDVLTVGQKIGAKYYTFHGRTRQKVTSKIDPVASGKRLQELCEICSEYGIKLCLETVHWAMFNSPDFYKVVKEYAPDLGAVLDIKQCRQSGIDWRKYLDVIGDRLCNVHISDVDTDGNICMVGKGVFPFPELVEKLRKIDYNGPMIIEQYAGNYSDFSEVKKSVDYMKQILGGIYAN